MPDDLAELSFPDGELSSFASHLRRQFEGCQMGVNVNAIRQEDEGGLRS